MISTVDRYLIDRYWHLIAHRSEVADTNAYVRLNIGGEELAAFNDGSSVVVFDNLCPHRGTRIFDGEKGKARFVCPYHGWSYARGKLFRGSGGGAVRNGYSRAPDLAQWRTEWLGDFLFAAKQPIDTLTEQLAGVGDRLARISRDIEALHDHNAYDYGCNWKIAVENAQEPYHIGQIHPDTLASLSLSAGKNEYNGNNSSWFSELENESMYKGLTRLGRFFDVQEQHQGYFSTFLFPFSMISSTFGYSYSVQTFLPSMDENLTYFTSRMYRSRLQATAKASVLASFFDDTATLNRKVFEEDHQICRRIPAFAWTNDTSMLTPSEEKIAAFRNSISQAISASTHAISAVTSER